MKIPNPFVADPTLVVTTNPRRCFRRFPAILLAGLLGSQAALAQVVWNGASGVDTKWSTDANWIGGARPTASDDAKFFDDGADPTPGNVNNIVDPLFGGTVASLQYAQSNLMYHTTQIDAGQTLTVLGNFIAGTEAIAAQNLDAAVTGTGTLLVSNTAAEFVVRQGGNGSSRRATLDMSGLDTFIVDVDRVLIGRGDPPGYPNINRNTGWLYLAKTNFITAETANSSLNVIGIEVGRSASNNGNGSRLYLGQTNVLFASSLGVGLEKETACQMLFNSIFTDPVLFIRGIDGVNRMDLLTIGEGEANSGTTSSQGTCDFTGGTVDVLVDELVVGRASSNTGGTGNSRGTLTFVAGTVNANTLEIGVQTSSTGKNGDGTVNVNGGTLIVNSSLELGRGVGGAGVNTTKGRLNINNATVMANAISSSASSGDSIITLTGGTLIVTNTAGANDASLGSFTMSDSMLRFDTIGTDPRMVVTNLNTGGAGNVIAIGLLPAITSYPAQFKLISYQGAIGGSDFNFTLTGLPGVFTGFLSNNTAEASVDLYLSAGPIAQPVTWTGTTSGDWDTSTFNWRMGSTATNFFDNDFATFDDTATGETNVNLTSTIRAGSVTVNNSSLDYTFGGSGHIAGLGGLTKDGPGTLTINNTAANSYIGDTFINGGTVQLGTGGTGGSLGSGTISNNASLVINRSDDVALANDISGLGSITKNNTNVLTLGGANSFSGAVTVTEGTLKAGSSSALGTADGATTVNSGATLDIGANNVNLGLEPVSVSGAGVDGAGAIINSSGNNGFVGPNIAFVTLTGHTTFGGTGRWDLRAAGGTGGDPATAALSTGGNAYNLTKVGNNTVNLVSITVDPALANIDIQEGVLGFEGNVTGAGNPSATLTVHSNASVRFYSLTNLFNKSIVVEDGGNLVNGNGDNTIVGPMQVNGLATLDVGGTSLNFSNAISGAGGLLKTNNDTLILSGPAKTYSGDTTIADGTLVLDCINNGGGALVTLTNTILAGNGTNTGPVTVGGTLSPGSSPGTLTTGDLTLEAGAVLAFELSSVTTVGSGVNDLLQVNGDLTANGNSFNFSLLDTMLQAGTYRLINYTGNLIGDLDTNVSLGGASRYVLTLDTNTPGEVNLTVSGSTAALVWNSTTSSAWDINLSPNWLNTGTAASDVFFQADSVLFDDTLGLLTTVDIADAVAPAVIRVDSTNNYYTFNGPGKITGGGDLIKKGDSILVVNSTNDFTGSVEIRQGTLQIGNNSSLGSDAGPTIVSNGATLDIGATMAANAVNLGLEPIILQGAGVSGFGALINGTSVNQQNAVRLVTLTGDTTLGGNGRWDIRGTGAALSTGGNAYKLTKVGANQISLVGVAMDSGLGDIDVQQGTLSIETSTSSAGNPARTIAIQPGATLQMFNLAVALDKHLAFTNGNFHNDSGNNVVVGPVVLDGSCTFDIDGGTSLTVSNDVGGIGGILTKNGTGVMSLAGVNSYHGDTTINAGTLALLGNSSIATSPNILLAANNTTLDASGRADGTLNLAAGQSLAGYGTVTGSVAANSGTISPGYFTVGRLTASGTMMFGSSSTNSMEVDKSGLTNDVISADTINYGGTLQMTATSLPFGAGDSYKLFNAANYSGAFSTITPATPGSNLAWDTSRLTVDGRLKVVSTIPLPPPNIATFAYSGTDVTLSGNNGPANGTYVVLTTTDLSLPASNWTPIYSNYFDAAGNFSVFVTLTPGEPQRYFMIQVP